MSTHLKSGSKGREDREKNTSQTQMEKERDRQRQRRKDVQQHITLMDIYCGALGLGWIRVYHVTKNTDTHTHQLESTADTHDRVIHYTLVTSIT